MSDQEFVQKKTSSVPNQTPSLFPLPSLNSSIQAQSDPEEVSLADQMEKASQFGYNGLDIPVDPPENSSPSLQRKLSLDESENPDQLKALEGTNPVFNGLNLLNVQRQSQSEKVSELAPHLTVGVAQTDRVQREPTTEYEDGSNDSQRTSVVSNAVLEVTGVVYAKKSGEPDDTGKRTRPGWEQLIKYFHTAAPGLWSDDTIKYNPKYGFNGLPSWCGIFALWALKEAGLSVGTWKQGSGISSVTGIKGTNKPKVGDIGYVDQPFQHHFIISAISSDGKTITSIDGNSRTDSEITAGNTRSRSEITAFYTAFPTA